MINHITVQDWTKQPVKSWTLNVDPPWKDYWVSWISCTSIFQAALSTYVMKRLIGYTLQRISSCKFKLSPTVTTPMQPGESAICSVRRFVFKSINTLATVTGVFDKLGLDGFMDTRHGLSLTSDQIKIPREAVTNLRGKQPSLDHALNLHSAK